MKYYPKRIINLLNIVDKRQIEEIIHMEDKEVIQIRRGSMEDDGIKFNNNINKGLIYLDTNITNYCYYPEKFEKRMHKKLKKAGYNLEEISVSFDEYLKEILIKEII